MKGNPMKKIILSAIALFLLIGGIGLAQPTRRSGSSPIERASPVLWNSDGSVYLPANVGIGTTSASSALSVVGDISATGEVSGATLQAGGTTGVSEIRLDANNTVMQSVDTKGIYLGDLDARNAVVLNVDGSVYMGSTGVTRFITSGDTLSTAISLTPSGGRLILSPRATYTVSSKITRTTPIAIIGNDAVITSSLTGTNEVFSFTAPVYVRDLTVIHNAGNGFNSTFELLGTGGNVFYSEFDNVHVGITVKGAGSQTQSVFTLEDAGGWIRDCTIYGTNTSTAAAQALRGVTFKGNSTMEVDTNLYMIDNSIYIMGLGDAGWNYGVVVNDNSATKKLNLYSIDNTIYIAGNGGARQQDAINLAGNDSHLIDYGSFLSGSRYDIASTASSLLDLNGTVLDHNSILSRVINDRSSYSYVPNLVSAGNVGIGTTTIVAGLTVATASTANFVDGAGDGYFQDEIEVDGSTYLGNALTDRLTIDSGVYQSNAFSHFKIGSTCYEVTFVPSYKVATCTCASIGM